ncbi:AAEL002961-PA [Aedes aegypti]|uniref:AAEL002961-PA n=2 Tax=Aedes aegypti TaxID=7159 RepID=A0A1S4F3L0_AEDAE|nr:uncharacterized protein LOC5576714 [Aedes aegypti]EAT45782.1 AAEL002961-PA [Aedes aegypti]
MAFLLLGLVMSVVLANVSGAIYDHQPKSKLCANSYSVSCLKMEIVSFLERLSDQNEYSVLSGVSVVRDANVNVTKTADIISEVSRIFPTDPNKRLDEFLIIKLNDYLKSHSLRLKLMDKEAVSKARELFVGRKGGSKLGKKGGLETMIAAAMMMKGTLGAIAMGGLAMLAGKALMTGLLAMTLATVVGLKSLTSGGGQKSTTYEIVAKPMYTHSHSETEEVSHGHGGGGGYGGSWGRSQRLDVPAYSGRGDLKL